MCRDSIRQITKTLRRVAIAALLATSLTLCACAKKGGGGDGGGGSSGSPSSSSGSQSSIIKVLSDLIVSAPPANPFYSNINNVLIAGSCVSGNSVILSGDVTASEVTSPLNSLSQTCTSGELSFNVQKAVDGNFNFHLTQVDVDGNSSRISSLTWVRDTTSPSQVSISSPAQNPYTSGSDSIRVTGTCESAATVSLSGDDNQSQVCTNSQFSFDLSKSVDGNYQFEITQIDSAGNTSTTAVFTWIRDTAVPASVTITTPGVSPYYSNSSTLTISGLCETNATVALSENGTTSATTTCVGSNYSFSVSKTIDGPYSFSLTQFDVAQNPSAPVTLEWVRDTVAPSTVTITSPNVNPYFSGDTTLMISGSCEDNATVILSGDTSSTATCSSSQYSFNVSKNIDAAYNFNLSQTDVAGNASSSISFQWNRDTTIPTMPSITSPASSPYFSNSTQLVLSGGCVSGNLVELSGDDTQSMTCDANGSYSFTVYKTTEATYSFLISQTDSRSGNISAARSFSWTLDQTSPSAPTILTPSSSPYTSSNQLTLAGDCETDATVTLSGDDSQSFTCVSSAYSFTVNEASDGTYTYRVNQADRATNASASNSVQWIKDSSIPANPVVTSPNTTSYLSNTSQLVISGECTNGLTVTIGGDVAANEISYPAGNFSTTCSLSQFSFTIIKTIDGTYNFTFKQTRNGIDSGLVSLTWVRDTIAPTTTLSSTPTDPNLSASATFAFSANDTNAIFECSMDSGAYVSCTSPVSYSALSNGSHTFQVRAKDLAGNTETPVSFTWRQEAYNTIALYHFDTANGVFADSSLFSTNNSLTNSSTSAGSSAQFGESREFSAASSTFLSKSHTTSQSLMKQTMSAEAFVKFSSLPANGASMVIASKSGASGQYGWILKLSRIGSKYYLIFSGSLNGTSFTDIQSTSLTVTTTAFHHIAVTWNLGTVSIYFDGALKKTGVIGTAGSSILWDSNADLRLGRDETGNYFNGILDEVRLSQTIRWSSSFTPPTSPYIAD